MKNKKVIIIATTSIVVLGVLYLAIKKASVKDITTDPQLKADYDDLIKEVLFYFSQKIEKARSLGINDLIVKFYSKTLFRTWLSKVLKKMYFNYKKYTFMDFFRSSLSSSN